MSSGTVRTESQLLALFADNSAGNISAQDARDFICTFFDHANKSNNPHGVNATQVGAIVSINGVSNAGGNIDLIESDNIIITPNDTTNTIAIEANDTHLNVAENGTDVVLDADKIDFVYGLDVTASGTNFATATVNVDESELDHDLLGGFVPNEHIDHSSVSVIAGVGLSGGGTIVSDRTLNVDIIGQTTITADPDDHILIADFSDSNNIRKVTAQSLANLTTDSHIDLAEEGTTEVADADLVDFREGLSLTASGTNFLTGIVNVDINKETLVSPEGVDELLIADDSDGELIKKVTAQSIADLKIIVTEEDDLSIVADTTIFNFGDALNVIDATGGQADIDVDIAKAASATIAAGDLVLIADVDNSNAIRNVTAQSIADLVPDTHLDIKEEGVIEIADANAVDFRDGLSVIAGGTNFGDGVVNVDINKEELVTIQGTDEILIADASDSFSIKKATAQDIANLTANSHIDLAEEGTTEVTDADLVDFRDGLSLTASGTNFADGIVNVDINKETLVLPAADDEILISDASDTFNIKKVNISDVSFHFAQRQTTNASTAELTVDGAAPGASNRLDVPNNTLWTFRITVSARQSGGVAGTIGDSKGWDVTGIVKNQAGTTSEVTAETVTVIGNDAGASAWTVTTAADDTNDSLQINVTGEADKTIEWAAKLWITEAD